MPVYVFQLRKSNRIIERVLTVKQLTSCMRSDGGYTLPEGVADQNYSLKINSHMPQCWPLKSDAAGVHPKQVKAAEEDARRAGINLNFDHKTGQAIFESRGQRSAYLKHRKMYDHDGGYGDG